MFDTHLADKHPLTKPMWVDKPDFSIKTGYSQTVGALTTLTSEGVDGEIVRVKSSRLEDVSLSIIDDGYK